MTDWLSILCALLQRFVTSTAVIAVLLLLCVSAASADKADQRMTRLAHTLTTSKASKARLSAAIALGDTRDKRALRPLIRALKDKDKTVRAVAAMALGNLGDTKALPSLQRATQDEAKSVRRSALTAIARIRATSRTAPVKRRRVGRMSHYQIPATERPRLTARKPEVFVVLKSTADDSKKTRKRARKKHEKRMRTVMAGTLGRTPGVTMNPEVASEHKLSPYYIDLSILDFKRRTSGPYVEVECELRVAVSDKRGKMLSILTGGAKVQVPKRTFRRIYEAKMRGEALDNAVEGIQRDVVSHLQKNPSW